MLYYSSILVCIFTPLMHSTNSPEELTLVPDQFHYYASLSNRVHCGWVLSQWGVFMQLTGFAENQPLLRLDLSAGCIQIGHHLGKPFAGLQGINV